MTLVSTMVSGMSTSLPLSLDAGCLRYQGR
jgi:hypothetical protein